MLGQKYPSNIYSYRPRAHVRRHFCRGSRLTKHLKKVKTAQEAAGQYDQRRDQIMCGRLLFGLVLIGSKETSCARRKNQDICACDSVCQKYVTHESWAYVPSAHTRTSKTKSFPPQDIHVWLLFIQREYRTRVCAHYFWAISH